MTNLNFLKLKLFFKRFIRKPEKTLKKFWLSPVYVYTISLKSKGARMGKGKGKKLIRMLRLHPGKTLLEVSNIRTGRMLFFLSRLELRLNTPILLFNNVFWGSLRCLRSSVVAPGARPFLLK